MPCCPSLGDSSNEDLQLSPASPWGDNRLERVVESRGAGTAVKDQRIRCQHPVRLALYDLLEPSTLQGDERGQIDRCTLGFQLQSVPDGLPQVCRPAGIEPQPLPLQAQRSFDRPCEEPEECLGGPETGKLEKCQVGPTIREGSSLGPQLGDSSIGKSALLPSMRKGLRGLHARPQAIASVRFPRRNEKSCYIADLFSGEGGVAAACERLGFSARQWDIRFGHRCDLTSEPVLRALKHDVKTGKAIAVMMAPPCDSFSVARDRTKVIRTALEPWGVSAKLLTEVEQHKIQSGNACFSSCFALIRILDAHHVPWILENPASSNCWYLPFFKQLVLQPHVKSIVADFCQFGTPWRKRAKFLAGNISADDLHRIEKRCSGRGLCDQTHRAHFQLTGTGPGGRNWTAIAQPYPKRLCDALAHALTAQWHYNQLTILANNSALGNWLGVKSKCLDKCAFFSLELPFPGGNSSRATT